MEEFNYKYYLVDRVADIKNHVQARFASLHSLLDERLQVLLNELDDIELTDETAQNNRRSDLQEMMKYRKYTEDSFGKTKYANLVDVSLKKIDFQIANLVNQLEGGHFEVYWDQELPRAIAEYGKIEWSIGLESKEDAPPIPPRSAAAVSAPPIPPPTYMVVSPKMSKRLSHYEKNTNKLRDFDFNKRISASNEMKDQLVRIKSDRIDLTSIKD